ncbi:MAG: GtrA family protein, partial [Gaiellaceae bacterium]
ASGYWVNLGVYTVLVLSGVHYLPAAVCSFVVAVANNYTWNRVWTFRRQRGHLVYQGVRFLAVSGVALGGNLAALGGLVALGLPKIPAQAIAILLVMPWNFLANKLWSFRR